MIGHYYRHFLRWSERNQAGSAAAWFASSLSIIAAIITLAMIAAK